MTDDDALKVLVALGDKVRFEIFRRLLDDAMLTSAQLVDGKSPATISHHLKILERAGLIAFQRNGKQNEYWASMERLSEFSQWAARASALAGTSLINEVMNKL